MIIKPASYYGNDSVIAITRKGMVIFTHMRRRIRITRRATSQMQISNAMDHSVVTAYTSAITITYTQSI